MKKMFMVTKMMKKKFLLSILLLFGGILLANTVKNKVDGELLSCIINRFIFGDTEICSVYQKPDYDRTNDGQFDKKDVDMAIEENIKQNVMMTKANSNVYIHLNAMHYSKKEFANM